MSSSDAMDTIIVDEQPIAVRRSKRRSSVISPQRSDNQNNRILKTPSKCRSKKRVRFSDPQVYSNDNPTTDTGLTPYLDHTSISTPQRRVSTPARIQNVEYRQFTPFREVLSERSKRRIRRNGLSDEMNAYETEKKILQKQIDEKDRELRQLRQQVEASKHQQDLVNMTASQIQVDEVEAELETLRQSFNLESREPIDWSHIPSNESPRLGSDGGDTILIYEDDIEEPTEHDAADAMRMGLELETARQAKQILFHSTRNQRGVEIEFQDSPIRHKQTQASLPPTPNNFHHDILKQLKATTTRAEDAELALRALEEEIKTLGFSEGQFDASGTIATTLKAFRQARLDLEHIMPGETTVGFDNSALFPEIFSKLRSLSQQVRDREAELKSMHDQQRSLKGNFDHAIVVAEKATARVKELEEAMDNSAEEMLQERMRAQGLEREVSEKDANIESLISALSKYREDIKRLEELINKLEEENVKKIEEVRHITATQYAQHVSDCKAKVVAEERGRRAAEESAISRLRKIEELESTLSSARQHAAEIENDLEQANKHLKCLSEEHKDEAEGLTARIDNLATALTSANAEVDKLRIINNKLEERYRNEIEQGALAVEGMQADFLRSVAKVHEKLKEKKRRYIRGSKVRRANWELESDDLPSEEVGPMTPSSVVRFSDFEDNDYMGLGVELHRGQGPDNTRSKRHSRPSYDSGVGMDSLVETDEDELDYGLTTPDLSSDADFEIEGAMVSS